MALVVGLVTDGLGHGIDHRPGIVDDIAYGLPALRDGRWWTYFVGAFVVPQLVLYLPVLGLLVVAAGAYERRVGHAATLAVVVAGQVAGALATSLFLWAFAGSGWTWAERLGTEVDLGLSGGGLAVLGALTAVLQPVWRRRVRVGVSAYLVAMLLRAGQLWDVEHLASWSLGVAAGPFLAGRRPQWPRLHLGRRSQRALVSLIVAFTALSTLIEAIWPGNGGPFYDANEPYHSSGVTLTLVVSSLLWLVLADALRRGRRLAWLLTTLLLAGTFAVLVAARSTAERTADLVIIGAELVLLLATVGTFNARAQPRSFRRAGRRLLVVGALLLAYTAIGFAVLAYDFSPKARPATMIAEFFSRMVFTASNEIEPVTTSARFFVRSIGAVWIVTVLGALIGLLYSSRRAAPQPDEGERLRALLRAHRSSSIGWMLTWKGNDVWFSPTGRSAVGYRVVGSVALALSDPVGPVDERVATLRGFDHFCFERGWIPCFFAAGQPIADLAPELRWKAVQVAEDSIVPLEQLEFRGRAWQDVRTALNRAEKEGIALVVTRWADARPVVTDQLRAISHGWVSGKSLPEMGFTLGTLAEAEDPEVRLALAVDGDGTVHGFTSWLPVSEDGVVVGWTIDLMRRREGGFRQVIEFLIGAAAMSFKEEGYRVLSLSAAPLAKAPERAGGEGEQEALQRLLDFLGDALEPYYGFRSLLSFKAKFQPEFRPLYLVFPDETALAEIGLAIVRAYLPQAGPLDLLRLGLGMVGSGPDKDRPAASFS